MEIKTKLNIGDTLWVMYCNKPKEIKIESISIYVDSKFDGFTNKAGVSIYYCGYLDVFRKDDFRYAESNIDKDVFLTKEDLINSLL